MNQAFIKEIYIASLLSKLSYHPPSDFFKLINAEKSILNDLKYMIINNHIYYIEENDVKCIIFKYKNIIYISIDSSLNYNESKKLTKICKKIKIHKGLFEVYKKIENDLYKNISKLVDENTIHINISGFYVGGTLATIVAACMADKYHNIYLVTCITFASPKVGNCYFKKYFNKYINRSYRINTKDDNFIRFTNYKHVSNTILVTNNHIMNVAIENYYKKWTDIFTKEKIENIDPIETYIEYLTNIRSNKKSSFDIARDSK